MTKFVPICGPVVADTYYVEGQLVAKDVAITLPEVAPITATVQAMGNLDLPIWQILEHMEAAITKIGLDKGLRSALTPESKAHEVRWVQTITDAEGNTKNVGCKAFLRGIPANLPEIGLEVANPSEHETRIAMTRYNLFVDGEEMWLIDRLAGIVRIAGKDYADLDSLL